MAGKVTTMSTIKQLLQLHASGVSNRGIAKTLGLDKETVNEYVRKLQAGKMQTEELLKLDDPVLEGSSSQVRQPTPTSALKTSRNCFLI
jgi:FixJ family two-component response regulator